MADRTHSWGLSSKVWRLAGYLGLLAGLVAVLDGVATGSMGLLAAGCALVFGAGLVPSWLDLRSSQAAVEAIRRRNERLTAIGRREPDTAAAPIAPQALDGQWVWIEPEQRRLH